MAQITSQQAGGVNVLAFLDMLAWSEGTDNGKQRTKDRGYDVIVGGQLLKDYADQLTDPMKRRAMLKLPGLALGASVFPVGGRGPSRLPPTRSYTLPWQHAGESLTLALHRRPAEGDVVLYVHGATFPSAMAVGWRMQGVSWMDDLQQAGFDAWHWFSPATETRSGQGRLPGRRTLAHHSVDRTRLPNRSVWRCSTSAGSGQRPASI